MLGSKLSRNFLILHNRFSFVFFKDGRRRNQDDRRQNVLFKKDKDFHTTVFTAEDYNKITQTNRYFQGIRLNTNYAKFYNEDTRAKQANFTGRNISDLPFQAKQITINHDDQPAMSQACGKIYGKINFDKLGEKIRQLSKGYFVDLIKGKNGVKIEPNFERQGRRTIGSLTKDGYTFQMTERADAPQFNVESVKLFKGVEVSRNNNYTTDSYKIIEEDGYTFFKLFQKADEKLPEEEWFSQKNVVMRMVVNVQSPFSMVIGKRGASQLKVQENHGHQFTFEMNLRTPAQFSDFSLSPEEYLQAYRTNLSDLTITDVDGRNMYLAYTYDEKQKSEKLINKLL